MALPTNHHKRARMRRVSLRLTSPEKIAVPRSHKIQHRTKQMLCSTTSRVTSRTISAPRLLNPTQLHPSSSATLQNHPTYLRTTISELRISLPPHPLYQSRNIPRVDLPSLAVRADRTEVMDFDTPYERRTGTQARPQGPSERTPGRTSTSSIWPTLVRKTDKGPTQGTSGAVTSRRLARSWRVRKFSSTA